MFHATDASWVDARHLAELDDAIAAQHARSGESFGESWVADRFLFSFNRGSHHKQLCGRLASFAIFIVP